MNKQNVTVKYKTADGEWICVEVSTAIKELLEQSDRQIRSQRRQDRRHLDYGGFIDGLTDTAMMIPRTEDVADLVVKRESIQALQLAMTRLPIKQFRRIRLYYGEGLTHQQIAELENKKRPAITLSMADAIRNLRTILTE